MLPVLIPVVSVLILFSVLLLLTKWSSASKEGYLENRVPLPGPYPWPILGNSPLIGKYRNAWDGFSALRKKYGDIYGIKLGSRYCTVVSSGQTMRQILVNQAHEFTNRPDFSRFHAIFRGNRNLSVALCDWSPKHRTRRDTAFPTLHPRYTSLTGQHLSGLIEKELVIMVNSFMNLTNQHVDPKPIMLNATANIFYQFICGKRFDVDNARFQEVVRIYDEVFRELFQGFAIDFMPWLRVVSRGKLNSLKSRAELVGQFTEEIFKEHEIDFDASNPRDLVDQYLAHLSESNQDESSLTREDAEVNIDDLIGGHSVLTNMWLWAMYLLALNPNARLKIRMEGERVVFKYGRNPSLSDRNEMPYTEATVYEVLRIVASPIIPHVAVADTTIEGYYVPKDTMVMFNTFDLNFEPTLWEAPLEFRPERFLVDGKICKPTFFFPFGVGKRSCMGDGLVKSILLLGLSSILRATDFILTPETTVLGAKDIAGIVVPRQPIRIIFKPWEKELIMENQMPSPKS